MKVRTIGVISFISVVVSVGSIWAGPVGVQRSVSSDQQAATVTELQVKRDQVTRQMLVPPYNKGPILIHNMDRASQLNDLINRIQSGQPVSPDEIDQQLQAPIR
jgi:hypothetical protein